MRTEPNAARLTTTTATDATAHSDMTGITATYNWVSSLDNLVPLFSLLCFRDHGVIIPAPNTAYFSHAFRPVTKDVGIESFHEWSTFIPSTPKFKKYILPSF